VLRANSPRLRAEAMSSTFCVMRCSTCAATVSMVEPDGKLRVIERSMDSLYAYS
jgi:hypothetical protein